AAQLADDVVEVVAAHSSVASGPLNKDAAAEILVQHIVRCVHFGPPGAVCDGDDAVSVVTKRASLHGHEHDCGSSALSLDSYRAVIGNCRAVDRDKRARTGGGIDPNSMQTVLREHTVNDRRSQIARSHVWRDVEA